MSGLYTILLLFCSNIFMTLAWYGHLRLQQTGVASHWPLIGVIAFSWLIAFFEYCFQVPANRIGYEGNGGPYSLVQLKVIQECISLIVFAIIANMLFKAKDCIGTTSQHSFASSQPCISCSYKPVILPAELPHT